jgi:polycomb protein EED
VGAMSRSTLRTNELEAKAPKAPVTVGTYSADTVLSWESKYNIDSPHRPLKAHKVEAFGMSSFVGRQVGWSPGGEWCVVVGSSNVALILQRW